MPVPGISGETLIYQTMVLPFVKNKTVVTEGSGKNEYLK
jgi:hypothetical protein